MITWDEAIKRGLHAKVFDNMVYFYGAKGCILTEDTMNYLIQAEPGYWRGYTEKEIAQIKHNSLGKIGGDCSYFTGWVAGEDHCYSIGQFVHCTEKTRDLAAGKAGSLLFTTYGGEGRHVGRDIGYGYFLHMAWPSTDQNIEEGKAGIVLDKIIGGKISWEWSVLSDSIDYTGADNR